MMNQLRVFFFLTSIFMSQLGLSSEAIVDRPFLIKQLNLDAIRLTNFMGASSVQFRGDGTFIKKTSKGFALHRKGEVISEIPSIKNQDIFYPISNSKTIVYQTIDYNPADQPHFQKIRIWNLDNGASGEFYLPKNSDISNMIGLNSKGEKVFISKFNLSTFSYQGNSPEIPFGQNNNESLQVFSHEVAGKKRIVLASPTFDNHFLELDGVDFEKLLGCDVQALDLIQCIGYRGQNYTTHFFNRIGKLLGEHNSNTQNFMNVRAKVGNEIYILTTGEQLEQNVFRVTLAENVLVNKLEAPIQMAFPTSNGIVFKIKDRENLMFFSFPKAKQFERLSIFDYAFDLNDQSRIEELPVKFSVDYQKMLKELVSVDLPLGLNDKIQKNVDHHAKILHSRSDTSSVFYVLPNSNVAQRLVLPEGIKWEAISGTSLLLLSSYFGQSGTQTFLYDLINNQGYQFPSQWNILGVSPFDKSNDRYLLLRGYFHEVILDLNQFSKPQFQPRIQSNVPLDEKVLNSCRLSTLPAQPVTRHLVELRSAGNGFHPQSIDFLKNHDWTPTDLQLMAHIFQARLIYAPDSFLPEFERLNFQSVLDQNYFTITKNPCLVGSKVPENFKKMLTYEDGSPMGVSFPMHFEAWNVLAPFLAEWGLGAESNHESYASWLALAMESQIVTMDIFPSKLYYLAKAITAPLFGKPKYLKVDIISQTLQKKPVHFAISTYPIDGHHSGKLASGLWFARLQGGDLPKAMGESVTQEQIVRIQGEKYQFKIKSTLAGDLRNLISKSAQMDYSPMVQDNTLTGIILIGKNLTFGERSATLGGYQHFLGNEGYVFEPWKQVEETTEMLKQLIQSGTADWMIKEAHSDGDEKNLLRVNSKAKVLRGRKQLENGKTAIVYLIAPRNLNDGANEPTTLISNQMFGEWVRGRSEIPFIFLNASCSSIRKAINELTAARSKNLIILPSSTLVYGIGPRQNHSVLLFIRGMNQFLDWQKLKDLMDLDPLSRESKANRFLFPMEEAFDKHVREQLGMTFDTHSLITHQASGREIHIDEAIAANQR